MVSNSDYYRYVPKDVDENLRFRGNIRLAGKDDRQFCLEERHRCAADLLYYVNTYVWTYDPRDEMDPRRPFVTWPKQDEYLLLLQSSMGKHDVVAPKSRDTGLSWGALLVIDHAWRFSSFRSFLLVSRKETLVDDSEDPDSLMWKLDFIHRNLPPWLRPRRNRRSLHIYNEDTSSTIDGSSTTGNVGRGGRRRAVLLDEFAAFDINQGYDALGATQANTKTRWFVSSPKGIGNAFSKMNDLSKDPDSPVQRIEVSWKDWPEKAAGMYTSPEGRLRIIDKDFPFPEGYKFILDGKVRSPYYDEECRRTPTKSLIASELDIEFVGSGSPFFDKDSTDRQKKLYAIEPKRIGEFVYDHDEGQPIGWRDVPSGKFKAWTLIDHKGRAPHNTRYVLGVDVSAGTGASNSCVCICDVRTGEKVVEYVDPNIRPEAFAALVAAMGRWFVDHLGSEAFVVWEAGGPGSQFGARLRELGYGNIYFRPSNAKSVLDKKSTTPGFWHNKDLNLELLGEFARATQAGEFIDRSEEALEERYEYEWQPDGTVDHNRATSNTDSSGARQNHGDRVMAGALCWLGMREVRGPTKTEKPPLPIMSPAYRRQQMKVDDKRRSRDREFVFS